MILERDFGFGEPHLPTLFPEIEMINILCPRSGLVFRIHQISTNWLINSAKTWDSDPDFCKFYSCVKSLKVVNDISERGIKLCSDYLQKKNGEKRKQIYQVVEDRIL